MDQKHSSQNLQKGRFVGKVSGTLEWRLYDRVIMKEDRVLLHQLGSLCVFKNGFYLGLLPLYSFFLSGIYHFLTYNYLLGLLFMTVYHYTLCLEFPTLISTIISLFGT